jgi:two-component system response regulator DevR
VQDVNEGKSAIAPYITHKLMPKLFTRPEKTTAVSLLTDRELEVLRLASKAYTNKSIGVLLNISDRIVQEYFGQIFTKLQATSRTETIMRAVSLGWIPHTAMVSVQEGTGNIQKE